MAPIERLGRRDWDADQPPGYDASGLDLTSFDGLMKGTKFGPFRASPTKAISSCWPQGAAELPARHHLQLGFPGRQK